jgi:Asp-tRNA(Asn)/Glu-tRNA(Gln) amidotransferase A subunit family amidase
MTSDTCQMTVVELAVAYRQRLLSPVDAVEALLARIAGLDTRLHAFT